MPGIVDVARKAGVSITTVSRTFNPVSDYPVAQATRQRVLAAAAALQYSPSALARALVTRRSRIVGVLVGDIVDPYFAEIVHGIEDVARRSPPSATLTMSRRWRCRCDRRIRKCS